MSAPVIVRLLWLGEGEAEVDDADAAVAVDEHVVWLEVAVDEAGAVGGGEAATGLAVDGEDLAAASGGGGEPAVRVTPAMNSMAMKTLAVVGADVVDGDDVGVREAGERLRLAEQRACARALPLTPRGAA
jgi:hypothetical protein